ncbi:MAG TPA: hypothetical protein VH475_02705 [Tepidisphaeraceae bacterium]|jgi:hypothetical protein
MKRTAGIVVVLTAFALVTAASAAGQGVVATTRPNRPSWGEVTVGVIRVTADTIAPFPVPGPATRTLPSGGTNPPLAPASDVEAYERAYGQIEGRMKAKPAEAADSVQYIRWSLSLASEGHESLKRYGLVRAFFLARAAHLPLDTLRSVAVDVEPMLADGTAAGLAQRAEIRAALVDAAEGPRQLNVDAGLRARLAGETGGAFLDLFDWQMPHGFVERLPDTLHLAHQYLRQGTIPELNGRLVAAREVAERAFLQRVMPAGNAGITGRVVLVIDASGSMMQSSDDLREVCQRVLESLDARQVFDLIAFGNDRAEPFSEIMLPGTAPYRATAAEFATNVLKLGTSDPLPALKMAVSFRASRIWLISDGELSNVEGVLKFVESIGKSVPVDTVATTGADNAGVDLLKKIARTGGGEFRRGRDVAAGVGH